MQSASLIANDLACRRGYRVLFAGVSVSLAPGDALHIIGANGVGKSSLIRILAGLMRPYAGAVQGGGDLALMDERPALDPFLPLGEALAFWSGLDGTASPLTGLGLDNLLDVPVRFLSTGQKKRAAIARLVAQNAPIWLLDEPLNGLDAAAVTAVEDMIAAHRAAGGIVVAASHQAIALPGAAPLPLEEFSA